MSYGDHLDSSPYPATPTRQVHVRFVKGFSVLTIAVLMISSYLLASSLANARPSIKPYKGFVGIIESGWQPTGLRVYLDVSPLSAAGKASHWIPPRLR
jgi:hypothetical protein